jgi:ribosomal silencing factor RsfS
MRSAFVLIIATAGVIFIAGCQTPATSIKAEPVVPVAVQSPVEAAASLRTVFHGTQEFSLEEISGKVAETADANGYTYIAVEKDTKRIWVATSQSKIIVGDQVTFKPGEVKRNYYSKKLDRTFPMLVFSLGLADK